MEAMGKIIFRKLFGRKVAIRKARNLEMWRMRVGRKETQSGGDSARLVRELVQQNRREN
jgi:hypothetical protein